MIGNKQRYKKMLGMVIDNKVIVGMRKYFDLSTESVEWAFILEGSKGEINISCSLIEKRISSGYYRRF